MPVRRESLRLPDQNTSIWSDAHLKPLEDWFPAAIYLIQEQQRQQKPDYTAREKLVDDTEVFLDRLALLFAPTKVNKQTPKNVTATSYARDKSNASRYIYIAKNNGLSGDDEKCAEWLDEWFGLEKYDYCKPDRENKYWKNLLVHWNGRIEHYLKKARGVNLEEMISSQDTNRQYFQDTDENFDVEKFNEEWEEVSDILKRYRVKDGDGVDDIWMDHYNFWKRSSRQTYPPQRSRESQEREKPKPEEIEANKYQVCVYHAEMLGMPISIWEAMVRFRQLKGKDTVHFCLVERPLEEDLNHDRIEKLLTDWHITNGLNVSVALNRLRDKKKEQKIYLHCELQILLLFHQMEDRPNLAKKKFIGCSKLSCHLCWEILKQRDYKTRGTHGKVSANCAFPLPRDLDGMIGTFKRLEVEWNDLFKHHKDGKFPTWPNQVDTDPVPTDRNQFDKDVAKDALDILGIRGYDSADRPYEIRRNIPPGYGSFAVVYPAISRSESPRLYALKKIRIDDETKLNLVINEIKTLNRLKHQNILILNEAYYDNQDPRTTFLATSPWAPNTLHVFFSQFLKQDRSPDWYKQSLDPWPSIIRQCLEGLTYLHAEGVIHKDLKPHNILLATLDGPGTTKIRPIIADFNISKDDNPKGFTDNLGTYEFKAPELIRKSGLLDLVCSDKRSDIWSLGCCFALIAMLLWCRKFELHKFWKDTLESESGKRGFHTEQNRKRRHEVFDGHILVYTEEMLVHHNEFRNLVEAMLQHAPEDRPTAVKALENVDDLDAHLQVLNLDLPRMSICIRLGTTTVLKQIELGDLVPAKEFKRLCEDSFKQELSSRGLQSWSTHFRIIFFESPTRTPNRSELPSESIDIITTYQSATVENLSTWHMSLPFYELIASQGRLISSKVDIEAVCGFEIGSELALI